MRHALVPIHLIHEARTAAGAQTPAGQVPDAPPDPEVAPDPRPHRLATLFRRARALVVRTT